MEAQRSQPAVSERLPTVLIASRGASFREEELEMKCDAKEMPDPLQNPASWAGKDGARRELSFKDVVGAKSNQTRWIAASAFVGRARRPGGEEVEEVTTRGGDPVAMTVVETERRLLGIIGQKDPAAPAIWWAWPLEALEVATEGVQGMLRKRPRMISITAFGSRLELIELSSMRIDKSSFTMGQENAFLKALRVRA